MAVIEAERRKGPASAKRSIIGLRIPPTVLQDIDQRAQALRITRTEYMIRTALGEPLDPNGTEERLNQLEQRLQRLEELAYST